MRILFPVLALAPLVTGCVVAPPAQVSSAPPVYAAPVAARPSAYAGPVAARPPAYAGPVAARPPAYGAPVAVAPGYAGNPYCREQRDEARTAQRVANQEAREASYYGGRHQAYEAAAAQSEADRQRRQAQRAC